MEVIITGKSLIEKVLIKSIFKGEYAAHEAYLFYLKTLAAERVPTIYIDNRRAGFTNLKMLAEKQSKLKEAAEVQRAKDSDIIES